MNTKINRFLEIEAGPLFSLIEALHAHAEKWPSASEFYIQEPTTIDIKSIPKGMTGKELQTALQFWDLHSALCAYMLFVYWRSEQLALTLKSSLSQWQLLPAAGMARALVETASAFLVESERIRAAWEKAIAGKSLTPGSATEFRLSVQNEILQIIWGTRRKDYLASTTSKVLERTNILSLIDKAAKQTGWEGLRKKYEELCDAVHPSFGSSECFYFDMGYSEEGERLRVRFSRNAIGRSELPKQIVETSMWAIARILEQLKIHKRYCDSICALLKLGYIPDLQYFGIIRPRRMAS
jgi:hypothetical protein